MKNYSKDSAIKAKKTAFGKLNSLIEHLISEDDYKRATILSNWLRDYSNYISYEKNFVPARNIAYKRGDVIKVNFGFRLGSELGGVHYAVVMDNHNDHSSDTITVVPLSSEKGHVHPKDVIIGDELYKSVQLKYKALKGQHQRNMELKQFLDGISIRIRDGEPIETIVKSDEPIDPNEFLKGIDRFANEVNSTQTQIDRLQAELDRMKSGSIAKVGQITTISKLRIIDPKKSTDVLGGVGLSVDSMNAINDKMLELLIWKSKEN